MKSLHMEGDYKLSIFKIHGAYKMNIRTHYNKQSLKDQKINRKRFYFTVEDNSKKRGYNRTIRVYAIRKDPAPPLFLGFVDANTAAYVGDDGCAAQVIGKCFGYKHDNYTIFRKDVFIHRMY